LALQLQPAPSGTPSNCAGVVTSKFDSVRGAMSITLSVTKFPCTVLFR
jgi:hypothetical protein